MSSLMQHALQEQKNEIERLIKENRRLYVHDYDHTEHRTAERAEMAFAEAAIFFTVADQYKANGEI